MLDRLEAGLADDGPLLRIFGASGVDSTLMRIRVLESGEEADYRMAELLGDPEER